MRCSTPACPWPATDGLCANCKRMQNEPDKFRSYRTHIEPNASEYRDGRTRAARTPRKTVAMQQNAGILSHR